MELQSQYLADKFLRTYRKLFTAPEMKNYLEDLGLKMSLKDVVEYLEGNPKVFALQNKLYVTRAGAFTNELFSMKPTAEEWEQGVMVIGDRCAPFIDFEMLAFSMDFFIDGQSIPKTTGTFSSDRAIDLFLLYGEEYAPQYIASDPANSDLNLAERNFELPNTVKLTGLNLQYMNQKFGFEKGDRLLCCVNDWNQGLVNMMVVHDHLNKFNQGETGEKRLKWYAQLEDLLLQSFDRLGPGCTVEEQLANVFFENRKELCVSYCGTIEEFLDHYTRKIGMEFYGVETRLWRKGETVPAVGRWNNSIVENARVNEKRSKKALQPYDYIVPPYVIQLHLMDTLYRRSDDLEATFNRIYPKEYTVPAAQKKQLMLHMREENVIMAKAYNWFQDQNAGPCRKSALEIYGRVSWLVYKIDCVGSGLGDFPQQELVILSQLYGHLGKILENICDNSYTDADYDSLVLSLEGMRWNFEDIEGPLEKAVKDQQTNKFKVVKV